jgi:flagellar hook-associated protein 3 FlgL
MSLNPIASRVPTLLSGRLMGGSIAQTQREMLDLQLGFASGTRLQRGSDDPRATRAIQLLQSSMDRRDQRLNAISWGEAVLGRVDTSLSSLTDLVTEARALAVGQSDDSADADSRAAQAVVVSSMIDQLFAEANAEWQGLHIFGGQNGGQRPFASFLGGVRYLGSGAGLVNDNGLGLPITLSGDEAFGAVSARVAGQVDLNPALSNGVYLEDLGGVDGVGVTGGVVELTVGANTTEVDLSGAATVGEVLDRLQAELDNIAPGSTVSTNGSRFSFTVAGADDLTVVGVAGDIGPGLGLEGTFVAGATTTGGDTQPKLLSRTRIADLEGLSGPLGSIRLENGGNVQTIDLSGAETIADLQNLIDSADLGIRLEVEQDGTLSMLNEVSGTWMSVGEDGGDTATLLGLRSMGLDTPLSVFNDGDGVPVRSGSVDPETGLPNPAADVDFTISLADGRSFEVDLAGVETVGDVLAALRAAAGAATPPIGPAEFTAELATTGNGIVLTDNSGGMTGTFTVTPANGSRAAKALGLLAPVSGNVISGEDRSMVAVESLFTHLKALEKALLQNDNWSIEQAAIDLQDDLDRLIDVRGAAGARGERLLLAKDRESELSIMEASLLGEARDLDLTDAALQLTNLEQQLQATLAVTARMQQLTLLNWLG